MIRNAVSPSGLTLLEVMLATVVLTVAAAVTMSYVRQPSDRVKREACNLRVQQLEVLARQYQADFARLPSSSLVELADPRYLGAQIPRCPYDDRAYRLDVRSGKIAPHNHP